jgi:uncharacterized membrane protein YphA (DoxX/SURF4 family)
MSVLADRDVPGTESLWRRPRTLDLIGLLARLALGGVMLVAGVLKVTKPEVSARAVQAYQLLPFDLATYVGYGLPILEVVLGLLLVAGLFTRASAAVAGVLLVAFIIGIASAWARGLSIDCGCFGGGGFDADAAEKYPWEIARDVGLLALSLWLVWRPRTRFALDNVLFRPAERILDVEEVR